MRAGKARWGGELGRPAAELGRHARERSDRHAEEQGRQALERAGSWEDGTLKS